MHIKIIAAILVIAFLWQDVVWANPEVTLLSKTTLAQQTLATTDNKSESIQRYITTCLISTVFKYGDAVTLPRLGRMIPGIIESASRSYRLEKSDVPQIINRADEEGVVKIVFPKTGEALLFYDPECKRAITAEKWLKYFNPEKETILHDTDINDLLRFEVITKKDARSTESDPEAKAAYGVALKARELPPLRELGHNEIATVDSNEYLRHLVAFLENREKIDPPVIARWARLHLDIMFKDSTPGCRKLKEMFVYMLDLSEKNPEFKKLLIQALKSPPIQSDRQSSSNLDISSVVFATSHSLHIDSARYFNPETNQAVIVFNEKFFNLDELVRPKEYLSKNELDHAREAALHVRCERLLHELRHDNIISEFKKEVSEEAEIIETFDMPLWHVTHSIGMHPKIYLLREHASVKRAMHGSGEFFKRIPGWLQKKDPGLRRRLIRKYVLQTMVFAHQAKAFPASRPAFKWPSRYRERLYREEPIDNDLFITIFYYKLRLYVRIWERRDLKRQVAHLKARVKREPKREDYLKRKIESLKTRRATLVDEIKLLTKKAKGEIEKIAQKGSRVQRKKVSSLPLVKEPAFVSGVRQRFDVVVELVENGKDYKASLLVRQMLNEITKQQHDLVGKRIGRSRKRQRVKLPGGRIRSFRSGQTYYPRGTHKYRYPQYDEASCASLWRVFEKTDKGSDYELTEETVTIPRIRSRIAEIIAHIERSEAKRDRKEAPVLPGFEVLKKKVTLRKRTTERFSRMLDACVEELDRSPLKVKILAKLEIQAARALLGIGLVSRAKMVLKDADMFLKTRIKEAGAIRKSLGGRTRKEEKSDIEKHRTTRLDDLRNIVTRRNRVLKSLAVDIKDTIGAGRKWIKNRPFITRRGGNDSKIKASEAAGAIGASYWMREPEFVRVREAAFGARGAIDDLAKPGTGSKEELKRTINVFMDFIIKKCDDSDTLSGFMKAYRALYTEFRLKEIGDYDARARAFSDICEIFESNKNITRGSPEYYKYFAMFFIPVFLSTKGKKKPTPEEPITNPLFKAAQDLLRIIEAENFTDEYLSGDNRGLKDNTRTLLVTLGNNRFSNLKQTEKRRIIAALAEDHALTEDGQRVLKQMARLIKIRPSRNINIAVALGAIGILGLIAYHYITGKPFGAEDTLVLAFAIPVLPHGNSEDNSEDEEEIDYYLTHTADVLTSLKNGISLEKEKVHTLFMKVIRAYKTRSTWDRVEDRKKLLANLILANIIPPETKKRKKGEQKKSIKQSIIRSDAAMSLMINEVFASAEPAIYEPALEMTIELVARHGKWCFDRFVPLLKESEKVPRFARALINELIKAEHHNVELAYTDNEEEFLKTAKEIIKEMASSNPFLKHEIAEHLVWVVREHDEEIALVEELVGLIDFDAETRELLKSEILIVATSENNDQDNLGDHEAFEGDTVEAIAVNIAAVQKYLKKLDTEKNPRKLILIISETREILQILFELCNSSYLDEKQSIDYHSKVSALQDKFSKKEIKTGMQALSQIMHKLKRKKNTQKALIECLRVEETIMWLDDLCNELGPQSVEAKAYRLQLRSLKNEFTEEKIRMNIDLLRNNIDRLAAEDDPEEILAEFHDIRRKEIEISTLCSENPRLERIYRPKLKVLEDKFAELVHIARGEESSRAPKLKKSGTKTEKLKALAEYFGLSADDLNPKIRELLKRLKSKSKKSRKSGFNVINLMLLTTAVFFALGKMPVLAVVFATPVVISAIARVVSKTMRKEKTNLSRFPSDIKSLLIVDDRSQYIKKARRWAHEMYPELLDSNIMTATNLDDAVDIVNNSPTFDFALIDLNLASRFLQSFEYVRFNGNDVRFGKAGEAFVYWLKGHAKTPKQIMLFSTAFNRGSLDGLINALFKYSPRGIRERLGKVGVAVCAKDAITGYHQNSARTLTHWTIAMAFIYAIGFNANPAYFRSFTGIAFISGLMILLVVRIMDAVKREAREKKDKDLSPGQIVKGAAEELATIQENRAPITEDEVERYLDEFVAKGETPVIYNADGITEYVSYEWDNANIIENARKTTPLMRNALIAWAESARAEKTENLTLLLDTPPEEFGRVKAFIEDHVIKPLRQAKDANDVMRRNLEKLDIVGREKVGLLKERIAKNPEYSRTISVVTDKAKIDAGDFDNFTRSIITALDFSEVVKASEIDKESYYYPYLETAFFALIRMLDDYDGGTLWEHYEKIPNIKLEGMTEEDLMEICFDDDNPKRIVVLQLIPNITKFDVDKLYPAEEKIIRRSA
ncbi:hypothetical protein ACFL3J_02120 [Candidatus Omnitrophota bacterium]